MIGTMGLRKGLAVAVVAALGWVSPALADDAPGTSVDEKAATRIPAEGLAVLDCAPAPPAPADSCVLRVPPSRERLRIDQRATGDAQGDFSIETDLSGFAEGLQLSTMLVLIDLTPGLGGERKPVWERERALILDFVRTLPAGQPVALYGFNESLERLTDFTTDKAVLEQAVQGLQLRGANTRIATSARDAINILGAQQQAILRNLVIFSDGEEEGTRALSEVASAAMAQGVTVSTFGLFWRPVGAPQNGAGQDYLQSLSEGVLGATGGVNVRQAQEATAGLAAFADAVNGAIGASGLIVPRGTPVEADITVVLRKERTGEPGVFDEEPLTAHFTPVALRNAPSKPETAPAPAPEPLPPPVWYMVEWGGIPVLWWLVGGGALLLGLVVLGVAMARRGGPEAELESEAEALGAVPAVVAPPPPPPAKPQPRALAYFVRADTGERIGVFKARVTIGRSDTCDVIVADSSVSRLHAELDRRDGDSFALTDSGSLNKTRVNGKVISSLQQLKPGDTVTFGDINLRFTLA